MKKILVVNILLLLLLNSCIKDPNFTQEPTTNGNDIFRSWYTATQGILDETALVFQSDSWITAYQTGNDSLRHWIEETYFFNTRIAFLGGNTYSFYRNDTQLFDINTYGTALSDPDANWEIRVFDIPVPNQYRGNLPAFFAGNGYNLLRIRNLGNNEWQLTLDSATCKGSQSTWTISIPASENYTDLYKTNFTLSGQNTYVYQGVNFTNGVADGAVPVFMDCTIETPLVQYYDNQLNFDSGAVTISLSKEGCEDVRVEAKILNFDQYQITYRGHTATYDFR